MSEAEKKRRAEYKVERKKKILIQAIVILAVLLLVIASTITYFQFNKNYFITYSESSTVSHKVYLKENDFYEEDYLEGNMIYVTELIDKLAIDLHYCMDMEAERVSYDYEYSVVAVVRISDKTTGNVIFEPEYEIVPTQKLKRSSGGVLKIAESIEVVYDTYDKVACDFINTYKLDGSVKAELLVTMRVNVLSQCDELQGDSTNLYYTSLCMPLASQTAGISTLSSAPNGEMHTLACPSSVNATIFKVLAIVLGAIDIALIAVLAVFVYVTRNNDINYTIKVQRIVSSYKSYIQQINNEFDREGYQILNVNTFAEMLDIRDTIQSPVLMFENEDKTRTEFLIPTNTRILYMFEIKVGDYDDIYASQIEEPMYQEPEIDEPVEEEITEEEITEEEITEEEITEEEITEEEITEEENIEEELADDESVKDESTDTES